MNNEYLPFPSQVKEVIRHTDIEYTFRMGFSGDVRPGQFFEVSIPKFGEAPISVSGIGSDFVDLTIRRVGAVTNQIFEHYRGSTLLIRGPYGNGFRTEDYDGKELFVIAGGTGLSPVKGIVDHYSAHPRQIQGMTLVAGFKTPADILFREDFDRWEQAMTVIRTVDTAPEDYEGPVGLVTKYIPELSVSDPAQAVFLIVGPPAMMKFTVAEVLKRDIPEENIWISQERKMCCGLGKCGHCRIGSAYVCLDGPVFRYDEGKTLVD